jgi:hypothetical protein
MAVVPAMTTMTIAETEASGANRESPAATRLSRNWGHETQCKDGEKNH